MIDREPWRLRKSVLVEPTAFHDRRKMPPLLLQQPEILVGVGIDDQKVGEGAGNELAQLAFTLQNLDEWQQAEQALRQAREFAQRTGRPDRATLFSAAVLRYWLGQWDDALAELGSDAADEAGLAYSFLRERWAALLSGVTTSLGLTLIVEASWLLLFSQRIPGLWEGGFDLAWLISIIAALVNLVLIGKNWRRNRFRAYGLLTSFVGGVAIFGRFCWVVLTGMRGN